MDSARPSDPQQFVTLQEAAQKLAVSVDTLLKWNEYHILKPIITPTGQVGYTKDQIQEFVTIQQSFLAGDTSAEIQDKSLTPITATLLQKTQETFAQEIPYAQIPQEIKKKKSMSYSFFLPASLIGVLALGILVFTQQEAVKSFFTTHSENSVKTSQASTLELTGPIDVPQPTDAPSVSTAGAVTSSIANALEIKKTVTKSIATIQNNKTSSVSARLATAKNATEAATAGVNVSVAGVSVNDISTFANIGNTNKETSTVFDQNGNVSGDKAEVAMNIGGTGILGTNTINPGAHNATTQDMLLIMLILGGVIVFMKRPYNRHGSPVKTNPLAEKIFEIGQKLDGTVVVNFQGNIYKISKPELYSESDRFIERLMELGKANGQELEYDSAVDAKIKFVTPLSRLVTRLGFVGIKRELFFPRTSKNRVLFRRYITTDDLNTMGLTPSEIASDFLIA